jgi:hypothetical protein
MDLGESAGPAARIYYTKHRKWMLGAMWISLLPVLSSIYIIFDPPSNQGGFLAVMRVLIPILMGFNIVNFYYTAQIRLVISPQGIEYYGSGYSIRTTWDNVMRLGYLPGYKGQTGLLLHRPALHVKPYLRWILFGASKDLDHFIPLTQFVPSTYFIELDRFKKLWRATPLAQDLERFAPHLFMQSSPDTVTREQRQVAH